jgi:hypothetical protein
MEFYDDEFWRDQNRLSQTDAKPGGRSVEEGGELTEDDLHLELFAGNETRPVREGQPMGGQNFGKNNDTCSANDKNNPSQYAGDSNPFFKNTEPMEEHPENSNFKVPDQQGSPDYDKARPDAFKKTSEPKPEKVERGNGENDRPHKGGDQYQQEATENDQPNVAEPNELPDQQKAGEDIDEDERDHIET